MLRRLFFVISAFLMFKSPVSQLSFFIVQSLILLAYYAVCKPFTTDIDNIVESTNETIIFILGLRMISLFDTDLTLGAQF